MRFGLVGAGSGARLRATCYERLPDVTVSGVVAGADPEWATATYSDVDSLLAAEQLDAVDVCSLTGRQVDIVDACLDAGVGVVCQVPLGSDIEDAVAIHDAAKRTDQSVLVDGLYKFARENRIAKDQIDNGAIGTPTTVRTTRRLSPLDTDDETGVAHGTVLRRALSPDFARIRWLFGKVERVFTRTGSVASQEEATDVADGHQHAVAVARFASGAVGHLDVRIGGRYDCATVDFEYSGTEGRLSYDSEEFAPLKARGTKPFELGIAVDGHRPRPSRNLYECHAEHIVDCLCGDADPVESLDEALETFRTIEAAVESARRDESVAVAEVTG